MFKNNLNRLEITNTNNYTCRSLVEQQKRKLAQLEEIEKEAAEKEPSRWFSNSFSFIMVLNLNSN